MRLATPSASVERLLTPRVASDTSEQGDAFDEDEGYDAFDVTAGGE